jgi:ornithine cyclodeaminase/alanine dehydrogenase-like protein (mu-crystallin family)
VSEPGAPIRFLDDAAVRAAMPGQSELLHLAEVALRSLVAGGEAPPKAALPPGPAGVFAQAMPARLAASAVPGGGADADLLGMKWISGSPGNRALGRATLSGLVVLNDAETGAPTAILDAAAITAARTAALSGVAVRLLAPAPPGRPARAVLVGAGVQGRAHAEVLGSVLPGVELSIHDRHPERAQGLARVAAELSGVGSSRAVADPADALREADVIVTATSVAVGRPVVGPADVGPDALVVPVDYGAYVMVALVLAATTFAVDDRGQFEHHRGLGRLAGWPDPTATLGDLLLQPAERRPGIAVALHQGPGIADVLVADAVWRRAAAAGLGRELP